MPFNTECSETDLLKLQQSSGLENRTIRRREKARSDFINLAGVPKDELFQDLKLFENLLIKYLKA